MKKGDARRGELLAASEKLFYTKGYENTSVQDILDAVGFSKGGFYHHFDSKLAVLEAICQQYPTPFHLYDEARRRPPISPI